MLKRVLVAPAGTCLLAGLTLALLALLPGAAAFGQGSKRPRLVVTRLDALSFAPVPAAQMTEVFRKALTDTGAFEMLKPDSRTDVLCQNLSCALAVGKQAKANLVVYGGIAELDPRNWLISATLAAVDSGEVIRAVTLDQAGSPATQFPTAFKTLAEQFAGSREAGAGAPAVAGAASPEIPARCKGPRPVSAQRRGAKRVLQLASRLSVAGGGGNVTLLREFRLSSIASTLASRHRLEIVDLNKLAAPVKAKLEEDPWTGTLNPIPDGEKLSQLGKEIGVQAIAVCRANFQAPGGRTVCFLVDVLNCNDLKNEKDWLSVLTTEPVMESLLLDLLAKFSVGK